MEDTLKRCFPEESPELARHHELTPKTMLDIERLENCSTCVQNQAHVAPYPESYFAHLKALAAAEVDTYRHQVALMRATNISRGYPWMKNCIGTNEAFSKHGSKNGLSLHRLHFDSNAILSGIQEEGGIPGTESQFHSNVTNGSSPSGDIKNSYLYALLNKKPTTKEKTQSIQLPKSEKKEAEKEKKRKEGSGLKPLAGRKRSFEDVAGKGLTCIPNAVNSSGRSTSNGATRSRSYLLRHKFAETNNGTIGECSNVTGDNRINGDGGFASKRGTLDVPHCLEVETTSMAHNSASCNPFRFHGIEKNSQNSHVGTINMADQPNSFLHAVSHHQLLHYPRVFAHVGGPHPILINQLIDGLGHRDLQGGMVSKY